MSNERKSRPARRAATAIRAKPVARRAKQQDIDRSRAPVEFDDNPEWTEADFARARPALELHGPEVASGLVKRRGRPPMPHGERKEAVSIRLSPEVLSYFRAGGEGWQTRIDEALREHVTSIYAGAGGNESLSAVSENPVAWRTGNGVFLSFRDNSNRMVAHFVEAHGRETLVKPQPVTQGGIYTFRGSDGRFHEVAVNSSGEFVPPSAATNKGRASSRKK